MIPTTSGNAPFTISMNGETAETFYMIFGDLQATEEVPLVVGHGGGGTHHYLKSLSQLTEEYSIPVILYDHLGFGLSSHFPSQAGNASFWTVDLLTEQLHELVKFLDIESGYSYMGHSFGTVLGIELSSQPARRLGLRKLILWSPVASMELFEIMLRTRREKLPREIRETLAKHEADGTTDSDEYKRAMTASQHHNFCRLDVWPEELFESFSYSSKDEDAAVTLFGDSPFETKGTLKDWCALKNASNITVPTLLLNGHYDWSDQATGPLFWTIPMVKWVTFSNSSHLLLFEERDRFIDVVSAWLTD